MHSTFIFIPLALTFGAVLRTLETQRKVAAQSFLSRARIVVPHKVTQDVEMVVWPWRFWVWARSSEAAHSTDPQLSAAATSLRHLDRLLAMVAITAIAIAILIIANYPWPS